MCGGSWELKYQSQHGNNVTPPKQTLSFCFLEQYWQTTFSNLLFSWSQNVSLWVWGGGGLGAIAENLDLS